MISRDFKFVVYYYLDGQEVVKVVDKNEDYYEDMPQYIYYVQTEDGYYPCDKNKILNKHK